MSWLNFNDSLNSIKGQLTNFASGVLADGITDGADDSNSNDSSGKRVEELESLVSNQISEIETLRKQNQELQGKLSTKRQSLNGSDTGEPPEKRDDWFWDPYGADQEESDEKNSDPIAELRRKIKELEGEKKDLIVSLEQLDLDCQQTTEKIVNLKDALQTEHNALQAKYVELQRENEQWKTKGSHAIQELQKEKGENSNLLGDLKKAIEKEKAIQEELQKEKEEKSNLLGDLKTEIEKEKAIQEELQKEKEEKSKLLGDLKRAIEKEEELQEDKSKLLGELKGAIEKEEAIQEELQKEKEDKSKLLGDLKRAVEQEKAVQEELQKEKGEKSKLLEDLKRTSENKKEIQEELQKEKEEKSKLLGDLKRAIEKEQGFQEALANHDRELQQQKQVEDLKMILEARDSQIKEYEQAQEASQEEYRKLASILQGYEDQVTTYKTQYQQMKQDGDSSAQKLEELLREKQAQHRRYVDLTTESFKKFMDFDLVVEDKDVISHDNPEVSEFITIVEVILKLLLDLKWKTETLRKEVDDLTEEKTKILTEKNYEIEKLISNSEILSQEVITKSQALKHYEAECGELVKNNDLLIIELETYKNNSSGLQTISESNEDNLLLLESQLENANKRIKGLELTIADLENSKQEVNVEMQSELDYIKKQLNLTGTELSQVKQEYQELETEHLNLQNTVKKLRQDHEECVLERDVLNIKVDKIQSEFENTEYKYSEVNMDMESLKEENDVLKAKLRDAKLEEVELMRNEFDDLKRRFAAEIETKQLQEVQIRSLSEKLQNAKMAETSLKLQNDTLLKEWRSLAEAKENLDGECNRLQHLKLENERLVKKMGEDGDELKATHEELEKAEQKILSLEKGGNSSADLTLQENLELRKQLDELKIVVVQKQEYAQQLQALEAHVNDLNKSRSELINLVTTKHQESVEYHGEIQRLNQVLTAENEKTKAYQEQLKTVEEEMAKKKNEEVDLLTDQNNFLREKCELLAQNLLQEQATVQRVLAEKNHASSEKEASLSKELERLRAHLLEIQETHTKEVLSAETRNQEMQAKVNEFEQREKDSSKVYKSMNIRTNQQVETLQNQLQLVTNQRDELRKKMSDAEDQLGKQAAALSNLQFVLEQFQKDKEKDVYHETERIRRQINVEKKLQQELQGEIASLKAQLAESKQGLLAASRLTEQLEGSKQQLTSMKEEVSKLQQKLTESEEKYDSLISHTDAKVDKLLIKNLVVGFISANPSFNKDQQQILKLIATVLDFNQQDNEKIHLNKSQGGSWLNSILHPQVAGSAHEESLSQAFVRFLENESKPRQLPSLLDSTTTAHQHSTKSGEVSETSSRQSPILLSEVVLPTFADFGQNRNSSSILKDVLKNNSG